MQNEIFGIVKCDMKVPEHLETFFTEFPPIFKNTEIELKPEIIGPHTLSQETLARRNFHEQKILRTFNFANG